MVSLTEQDGALVAVLDVDDETADRISKGLILGAAAVLDPLANTLTGVQVTNRPGCTGLRGYDIVHVHGVVDLTRDVEALVLDPCYRDTPVQAETKGRVPPPRGYPWAGQTVPRPRSE